MDFVRELKLPEGRNDFEEIVISVDPSRRFVKYNFFGDLNNVLFFSPLDASSYGACVWESDCGICCSIIMTMSGRASNRNWKMLPKRSAQRY
jgi:hypothetical protein